MPPKVTCTVCQKNESLLWRTVEGGCVCQECFVQREKNDKSQETSEGNLVDADKLKDAIKEEGTENRATFMDDKKLRKSTRSTRFKAKSYGATSAINTNSSSNANTSSSKYQNKGRNRRSLFKRTPTKTPIAHASTHTVDSVYYKGSYLQVGDIVSLVDNQHNVYYAQIRGLLVDDYCEKSAFLTWLIPTQESPNPKEAFDPATYLIGPDEDLSRKLSCLEFVIHAPSDYYLNRNTPYPLPDVMDPYTKRGGYIWTTLSHYEHKNK